MVSHGRQAVLGRVLLLLLMAGALSTVTAALDLTLGRPFALSVNEPRRFGYTLGDALQRTVTLRVAAPYVLLPESLPSAGRIGLYLELAPVILEQTNQSEMIEYRLRLLYRIVNLTEPEQELVLESHTLTISDGRQTRSVVIPGLRLAAHRVAPRLSTFPTLQPDRPPPPIGLMPYTLWLAAAGGVLVSGLALLAYTLGLLPWLTRAHGPFAVALRELTRQSDNDYGHALRQLHAAFDRTYGRTLLAGDLEQFFTEHPKFLPLRQPIEDFFTRSRQRFFFDKPANTAGGGDLAPLCRQLRALERRL